MYEKDVGHNSFLDWIRTAWNGLGKSVMDAAEDVIKSF